MDKKTGKLPGSVSLHDVQLRIRESYRNANVGKVSQVVLKEGPRAFKIATVFEIVDPSTGDFHHHYLRLDHIDKTKAGWFAKPEKSMQLQASEIGDLSRFLQALQSGDLSGRTGNLHIIDATDYDQLANAVEALERLPAHDRLQFARTLLAGFEGPGPELSEFVGAFKDANRSVVATISTAARLVQYEEAYQHLEALVARDNVKEAALQTHLKAHPWMFGSEYSELLDRRTWTRDDQLDFMLRRTVDGFLELVEIKTPIATPLFNHDPSHDSHYPAAPLARVMGQVMRYIDEVERKRDSILATDQVDPLKIRARVIIGRDGDDAQSVALRDLNSHLTRIEVLTFDQLLRVARRVLDVFRAGLPDEDGTAVDGVPF